MANLIKCEAQILRYDTTAKLSKVIKQIHMTVPCISLYVKRINKRVKASG